MTRKQEMFIAEYLVDLNATRSAMAAGYSAKSAGKIGPQLLGKPGIAAAIQKRMDKRVAKLEITADRVLAEAAHAAFLDPISLFADNGSLLPLSQMPESARRAIAGIEVEEIWDGKGDDRVLVGYLKKIKLVSKEGTLTLTGRHLKMFTDKLDVTMKRSLEDLVCGEEEL